MRMKKLTAWALSAAMVSSMFPAPVFAADANSEQTLDLVTQTVTAFLEVDLPSNDELFALYAEQVLYGYEMATFGTVAKASLNDIEKEIYDRLKANIIAVAEGGGSTTFTIPLSQEFNDLGLKTEWTVDELNVNDPQHETAVTEALKEAFQENLKKFNWSKILDALLTDCPFELYWFDKTETGGTKMGYATNLAYTESAGQKTYTNASVSSLTFTFEVAQAYQGGTTTTVTTGVARVSEAKANAATVVADNKDKTAYDKLVAYKEYICNAVAYDHDAANDNNNTPYGDPWQLIYVFDNDPDNKVVCEGYSKAFQYLCDLDDARPDKDGADFNCINVTGGIPGGHMWNLVTLDGTNYYLVDVTNCDEGTSGAPDKLFLRATNSSSCTYTDPAITYTYDALGMTLKFAESDYALDYLIVTQAKNGTVTVSGNDMRATKGENVTLTVTPDEGYELESLTVKEQYGPEVTVTNNSFTMPAGTVIITAEFKGHEHSYAFDTPENNTIKATCSGCEETGSVTLSVENAAKVYDGKPFEATLTQSGILDGKAIPVVYAVKDGESLGEVAPTNAGEYTASITLEGKKVEVEFEITKADPTYTIPTDLTATYGQKLGDVALSTGFAWNDNTLSVGNVGNNSFTATYTPSDTDNYNIVENVNVTVKVNAKDITDADAGTFTEMTYTGQPQTPVATVTIGNLEVTGSWSQVTNVGEKSTFTASGNFTGTLERDPGMQKATPTVTAPTANTLTYNTEAQTLVDEGSTTGGTLEYSLEENGTYAATIPVGTDAKTYTVWYKVVGGSNYNDVAAQPVTVTIAPKTVTAPTFAELEAYYLYTGSAIEPTFTLKDGNAVILDTEYAVAYSDNTDVGTATITVTNKDGGNYIVSGNTTFQIAVHVHKWNYTVDGSTITAICSGEIGTCPVENKTATLMLTAPVSENLTYDGQAKEATVDGSIDGVATPSINYAGETLTNGQAINAGSYTASITVDGKTVSVEFTIAKAEQDAPIGLNVKNETLKGQKDGSISSVTIAMDSMEYATTKGGEYKTIQNNLAAGKYYVRYKETENYKPGSDAEVTIEEGKPITVTFDANGQTFNSDFSAKLENQSYGLLTKPADPTAANTDFAFDGWYKDSAYQTAWNFETDILDAENVTLYAKWKQVRFTVQVIVDHYTGGQVTATLMRGSKTIGTQTAEAGSFTFEHVDTGVYNLVVAANDDRTKTELITIDEGKTINITLPDAGVKSELNVKDAPNTPAVLVGGLDDVAAKVKTDNSTATEVLVAMDVEGKKEAQVADAVVEKIEQAISSATSTFVEYLDINITKSVDGSEETITETTNVIEIVIPFNFYGRNDVKIIRHHGDSAAVLDKQDSKPATAVDGQYWLDTENGYIHIYTKQFSTYAVSYTTAYNITFDVNGGDAGNDTKTTNSDATVTLPANPTRSGYTFQGWYTASAGGTKVTAETVFTGDTTVYAQWTQNSSGSNPGSNSNNDYWGGDYYTPSTPAYTVSVPTRVENGSVSITSKNATKGSTVTLTVTPDKGYELDTLTVTDKNGNKIAVTDLGNGKFSFTMPASKVNIKATFVETVVEPEAPVNPFSDVAETDYFFNAVLWANENGITSGVGNGQFAPNATCTRAQMVTFLWNAAGCPNVSDSYASFTDVSANDYYYKAVLWAKANNITSGTGEDVFSPNQICNRAQMATFLYKFAEGQAEGTYNPFVDVTANDYYAQPVQWAVENGITSGTGADTFGPADPCTRAQMVTFLYRLLAD